MEFADICHHAFGNYCKDNTVGYLLVDGAARKGQLLSQLYSIKQPDPIFPLFKNTKYADNLLLGPHLIPVQYDDPLVSWYQREGHDIGLLLFSQYPPAKLVKHLQPFLTCILPDDRRKKFRFYDPFIFFYVWKSFTEAEQLHFLGPIHAVVCPKPIQEKEGSDICFSIPESVSYDPNEYAKEYPWFISNATYAALNTPSQHSLTIMLSKKFQEAYPKSLRILGKDRVRLFCEKVVQMNETIKLTQMEDLMVLVGITSQLGTGFLTDPLYKNIVAAMENGETPQEKLYNMAQELEHVKKHVWHKYGKPYYIALRRLYNRTYEELCQLDTPESIAAELESIFPEQARLAGKKTLSDIVELGRQKARAWGLLACPGIAISSGILFFLGTGCEHDPLRPWIGDFVNKQMPADAKTHELFMLFRRILRFNFRTRTLEPEQKYAIWLNQFITPLRHFKLASRMPHQAKDLDEALFAIQPMISDEVGSLLKNEVIETLKDTRILILPLSMQTLLALVLIVEEAILGEDDAPTDIDQVLELYSSHRPDKALMLLEQQLASLVGQTESYLQSDFGGDIL